MIGYDIVYNVITNLIPIYNWLKDKLFYFDHFVFILIILFTK